MMNHEELTEQIVAQLRKAFIAERVLHLWRPLHNMDEDNGDMTVTLWERHIMNLETAAREMLHANMRNLVVEINERGYTVLHNLARIYGGSGLEFAIWELVGDQLDGAGNDLFMAVNMAVQNLIAMADWVKSLNQIAWCNPLWVSLHNLADDFGVHADELRTVAVVESMYSSSDTSEWFCETQFYPDYDKLGIEISNMSDDEFDMMQGEEAMFGDWKFDEHDRVYVPDKDGEYGFAAFYTELGLQVSWSRDWAIGRYAFPCFAGGADAHIEDTKMWNGVDRLDTLCVYYALPQEYLRKESVV